MNNEAGQLQVIEAILVGVIVFIAVALVAIFRLPTTPSTFQQTELEDLGRDALLAMLAKPPPKAADCNESGHTCPFGSELERALSLAAAYQGPNPLAAGASEPRDVKPFQDYLDQALPDGTQYILYFSNGVNATTIHPLNRVAPSLDVAVSRVLLPTNWTVYASSLADSVLLRIGERTGFTTATTNRIQDPLNRTQDEWGVVHASTFADATGDKRVLGNATYGTYKLCPLVGSCKYFTIVPPGVFGPGSPILTGDRDNSSSITVKDAFFNVAKYNDTNGNNLLGSSEMLYLDFNSPGSNTVSVGDLRITPKTNCVGTTTCPGGTFVKAGDADLTSGNVLKALQVAGQPQIQAALGNNNGRLDEGEGIYLDVDNSDTINLNDIRLSRAATFQFGSRVAATDLDAVGTPALATGGNLFTSLSADWDDQNLNGVLDPGEAVYLDLAGDGQSGGLEALDLHLSSKGSATTRYLYDVKLVVWFGI